MSSLRPVLILFAAVWFLQLAGGILSVIVPLGLSALGADPATIGLMAALYAAGMMLGAYLAPRIVSYTGNIRTFSAAASLTVIGSLALSFAPDIWVWAPIRILQGIGFAAMFASAEAWLGQAAPEKQRGNVLGAYNVAAKAALMTGPFLIAGAVPLAPYPFVLTGMFLACALIPVCLTRQAEPARQTMQGVPFRYMAGAAPAALFGCFMAGVINTGTFAFLPLFAAETINPSDPLKAAAWAFAAANAGGLLAQWPLGRLSDTFDRRVTIAGQCGLAAIAVTSLALFGAALPTWTVLVLLAVWGAGSLTFYGVCVAHGIDRMVDGRVTELVGVLIICWASGSVLGPIFAGVVVSVLPGLASLFAFTSAGLVLLVIGMLLRKRTRSRPTRRSAWHPAMPAPAGLMGAKLHRFRRKKRKDAL